MVSLYRLVVNFAATKSTSGAYSSAGELVCKFFVLCFVPREVVESDGKCRLNWIMDKRSS